MKLKKFAAVAAALAVLAAVAPVTGVLPAVETTANAASAVDDVFTFRVNGEGDGTLTAMLKDKTAKNVVVPATYNGKKVIEISGFEGSAVETVNVEEGIISIGISAFKDCTALKSITLPESLKWIGSSAFANCDSLTSVTIPGKVSIIGGGPADLDIYIYAEGYVFDSCDNLETVIIKNGVTTIEDNDFSNCPKLKNVFIPKSVKSVGWRAFWSSDESGECTANVKYAGSKADWEKIEMKTYTATWHNIEDHYDPFNGAEIEYSASAPADDTSKPADSTSKPADSTSKPADSTSKPADSTSKPADSTSKPADSTSKPADSTSTPSDSKDNPETGAKGIALTLGLAAIAGAAVVVYRKKK